MPTHKLQVLNVPLFVNNRRQYYITMNACLLCQGWITGFNPVDEQAFGDTW